MSWMAKLHETFDSIADSNFPKSGDILWPISHFVKNAHIEICIDTEGNFIKGRAKVLNGMDSPTLIPASESSAGRAGAKIAPHPLCEEIGYCAADHPKANKKKVKAYVDQLRNWADSNFSHPKVKAVYNYLHKETLWQDLSGEIEFPVKVKKTNGTSQKIATEKVFLRWSVEEVGKPVSGTWQDETLIDCWISYDKEQNSKEGFCHIIGTQTNIASNHPRFLRWPGDGAKLVSSNDSSGFTFRGRFTDTDKSAKKYGLQAVGIGFDVTQKAHNALRWLIAHQGYPNGDQRYITWAITGKDIPDPLMDPWIAFSREIIFQPETQQESQNKIDHSVDIGESFAHQFNKYLAGYRSNFEATEQILIMGVDSATPGRMSVTYYRELFASEFFDRITDWHTQFSWPQRHTKEYPDPNGKKKNLKKTVWPICSPSPRVIAEAAYGDILKSNDTLKKNVLERILPCIIDGYPFPPDIMISSIRRASNRNNCDKWEWERNLGVACALFKGFFLRHPDKQKRRKYDMALEEERNSRDYLYGRLLAIAERVEEVALNVGGENRPTTAARLMQRFADRPFSTWRNIELGLQPYMQRLQGTRAGFLTNRKKELDTVLAAFETDDFTKDSQLSGEFLLGYHCQKQYWRNTNSDNSANEKGNIS